MEINETIKNIKENLATRQEILFAYLYGSQAKGTATPQSDMDICVVLDDKKLPSDLYDYMFNLQDQLTKLSGGTTIEVVPRQIMSYPLYYTAILQGQPIYVREEKNRVPFEINVINNFEDIRPFYNLKFINTVENVERRLSARQISGGK